MANINEKGLIVKKVGMTRMVSGEGKMVAVTILKVEDQCVTKIMTKEKDGYSAYQVGFFPKAQKNLSKGDLSRLRKVGVEQNFARFKEFRIPDGSAPVELGKSITAEMFKDVQLIDVSGITKGRGTQGAVKRWGSAVGRMTHGSRFHRRPGSLGSNTSPGRVVKNKHQPGQMGVDQRTIKNLRVMLVSPEKNIIAVCGSVPGHREGYLAIRPTNKK